MGSRRLRLTTRLGITHGLFVAFLVIVFGVTLQGLVRMLGLVTDIREGGFSHAEAEEALHRSAWNVEVALRHGRARCAIHDDESEIRRGLEHARRALANTATTTRAAPLSLRSAADRYGALADAALASETCEYLMRPSTDIARTALDEELTNAWIDRLHELHADIEKKEEEARGIGTSAAVAGLLVTVLCAVAAIVIARATARSVSEPIARLAADAMRLGEGNFTPIPPVRGPREIEDLWRDLERAREQLAALENMKQAFLASVSHELRSPLGRLREALALLADGTCGPLNDTQRRVTLLAARACEREVRIVNALLDMSRLRSGLPLKRETGCDIDRVIEAAVQDERHEADERGVAIEIAKDALSPTLEMDSVLMERAIANLVRNAVSVSRAGQQVFVRRAIINEGPSRVVRVEVSDSGPGLADPVKSELFRPFAAATVSRERPAGIGLGLAFAHDVARAHDGSLTLARSDTTGTTFRLDLPAHLETL